MNLQRHLLLFCLSLLACHSFANQKPYVINFAVINTMQPIKTGLLDRMKKALCILGMTSDYLNPTVWNGTLSNAQFSDSQALAVESHYTIYTGGAEELGRWDRDQSGKLKYTSLNKLLPPKVLDNESFWRIWIDGSKVYFQTFRNIYVYDHQTMRQLTIPEGFLLLLKVRNEYWVQEMHGPLHQLKDGRLSKIEGSEFLNGPPPRVILPYGKDRCNQPPQAKSTFTTKELHSLEQCSFQPVAWPELNCPESIA